MTIYTAPSLAAITGAVVGALFFGSALAGAGVGLGAYLLAVNSFSA